MKKRVKILITNDDGIFGLGLVPLVEELCKIGEVLVIVPEKEMSATSHSLSLLSPVRVRLTKYHNRDIYLVSGTPADCVRLGFIEFQKHKTDIVVAGINQGANLGQDVIYSGTVAAAREATFLGIPGVAVSLVGSGDYKKVSYITTKIVQKVLEKKFYGLLNVNFPSGKIKGIKVTTLGDRRYKNIVHRKKDPTGMPYYWLKSSLLKNSSDRKDTDVYAIENRYVSITPILNDLTDKIGCSLLKKMFNE